MTGCTATLTTATVEPCDCVNEFAHAAMYGAQFAEHVTLTTLTCGRTNAGHVGWDHCRDGASWYDDVPGATPHADPLVSDAEVSAVRNEASAYGVTIDMRTAVALLEAAAEARTP